MLGYNRDAATDYFIVREAAKILANMLKSPDGLTCCYINYI